MLIGASIGKEDIGFYQPLFPGNDIMRIFPDKVTVAGKAGVGVLPAWTDARLVYCQQKKCWPFLSSKVDGYAAGLTYVKNQLLNLPSWILDDPDMMLYLTDRHEPEGDLGAGTAGSDAFKANFKAFLAMVDSLPATIRAKIKCGPILTKTWTEDNASTKGQFDYSKYDPMAVGAGGQFFGVDMYEPTGTASAVVSPSTLTPPATFVATFKAYKFNDSDTRPRIWPELGVVGMPGDTTGAARAAWIQGLYEQCKLMRVGQPGWTQPWSMTGFIWWNQEGKATGTVATVGQRRDFPLDERTVSSTAAVKLVPPLPLNKFNELWALEHGASPPAGGDTGGSPAPTPDPVTSTPVWSYWVGATMNKADLATYGPTKIPRNGLMRIFPNSNGLPPAWSDPRFEYCRVNKVTPFVSSNIDGDATKFAAMKQWIIDMPGWVTQLLLTDRHEPENNFKNDPGTYLTNYTAWWQNCIVTLPAATRAKVLAGPILTRQWIEGGATKGNGNYQQYDPGPAKSDIYALDMYLDSWAPGNGTTVATSYRDPVAFLAGVKGYRYNNSSTDTRPRVFAELGAIGLPSDPTGSARAAWFTAICAELDTWTEAAQGWKFLGFAWWNNIGTGGTALTPIGTSRYFYLDKYQNSSGALTAYADPLPLKAFNTQAGRHYTLVTSGGSDPGGADQAVLGWSASSSWRAAFAGAPGTVPAPPVVVPPLTAFPPAGPNADRNLQARYTILITDPYLTVLGDPVANWSSLQATIRWKEPGSGQLVIPAHPAVREQLVPGCRVVVLRRVLGTQHILIAGPVESLLWEKSDGADENAGYGKMTVTFVDDLAWLGARLSYPNPDLSPDNQTSDYWLYSGNPELGMLKLVSTQAGPQALAARQVPKLVVAPYSGLSDASVQIVGTSDVQPRERLEKVTDVLRRICVLGANSLIPGAPVYHPDSLGFRVRQTTLGPDPVLLFEPLRSRDLAGDVHFSFGKGNLKYFSYELGAPHATHAIVGGSGDGGDRRVREIITGETGSLVWGRFETYVASPGSDTLEQMQATAAQTFAEGLASARLASNAADTPDQRYGIHYNVGDIVSIELAPGIFESAPVQTVNLQMYPTAGEVVGITVGNQSARYDDAFIRRFRELDRRLGVMERRGTPTP